MQKLTARQGFTLIEILIVVAIIGILASVVLVGLGPVQKQGRDARRISDLKQVQTGLELFYAKNGHYPDATNSITDWASLQSALTTGGIGVSNVPADPNPTSPYQYGTNSTSYVLGASLEDTNNAALNGDVDGALVLGVNCTDPVYCVQL